MRHRQFDAATSLPIVFMRGWAAGYAQAIEARRAETPQDGSVHESAVRQDAPKDNSQATGAEA